jgi:hypothetical protein
VGVLEAGVLEAGVLTVLKAEKVLPGDAPTLGVPSPVTGPAVETNAPVVRISECAAR